MVVWKLDLDNLVQLSVFAIMTNKYFILLWITISLVAPDGET